MITSKPTYLFLIALLLPLTTQARNAAPWVGADLNGLPCNGLAQAYGPWDYTKAKERSKIPVVEQYHFGPQSEHLIKPMQGDFAGDFDYTLRAVPNHHRALLSLLRYQLELNAKLKNTQKPLSPVECYFQRATHFSPNDSATFSLYAYYLHKIGHNDQALNLYEKAITISPKSMKILYAFGLFLIDINNYDRAVEVATQIYKDKHVPDGLKNKLIKLNLWKNPGQ